MDLTLCRSHGLLRDLPPDALEPLLQRCAVRHLAAGEVLLAPGSENHTLYFLLQGQLQVQLHEGEPADRFVISPGETVGEMSIIERRAVMALVLAEVPSIVLAMPEEAFWSGYCSRPGAIPPLLRSLTQRIRKTDLVLREKFERQVRLEMLQRELESAAKIQANILPSAVPFATHATVDVCSRFRPARIVGGDFYDVVSLGRQRMALAIGDVSGKGMPAALFMMRAVTLLRIILMREIDPAAILPELNRQLCADNEESMFVTLALLLLDTDSGRVIYLNGGHNPVLLGTSRVPFHVWTPPSGPALGIDPAGQFALLERTLMPGETLVLYTDGVTEAENSRQELFGLQRTLDALSNSDRSSSAAGLVDDLDQAIGAFVGRAPQSDDITVLALSYRGADVGRSGSGPVLTTRAPAGS